MAANPKLNKSTLDSFNQTYKDGVSILQLKSWDAFHNVVKEFNGLKSYIWRGQDKEYALKAKIDRDCSDNRDSKIRKTLEAFKKTLREHRDITEFDDDEILAIGEHYGLETPLLNWTESPYIASYFAFYEKKESDQNPAVIYALNKAPKLLLNGKKQRYLDFDLPNSKLDHTQNQRLVNQKGRFTRALKGIDVESIVNQLWKTARKNKKNKYEDEVIFIKIFIPSKFKRNCLNNLKFMNITYETLFPDYAEDVKKCKAILGQK